MSIALAHLAKRVRKEGKMQFENAHADLLEFFANVDNGIFLLYGALVALAVQIIKKCFVNKLKIDLCNKFDFVPLLPFILGLVSAAINFFWVCGKSFDGVGSVVGIVVDGLTIGAAAVVVYKFVASFDKNSLKNLSKDGVFAILFDEIVLITDIKRQLVDNEASLSDIVEKLKKIVAEIKEIYSEDEIKSDVDDGGDETDETRLKRLKTALNEIVDESEADEKAKRLHETFKKYFSL